MLHDVCDTMNECKIEYWVDFGSLLGYYRERNVILHDTDADTSTWLHNKENIINNCSPLLNSKGYTLQIDKKFLRVVESKKIRINRVYSYCPGTDARVGVFLAERNGDTTPGSFLQYPVAYHRRQRDYDCEGAYFPPGGRILVRALPVLRGLFRGNKAYS